MTDQQIAKWIDQLQGELDVLKRIASNGSLDLSKLGDVSISNPSDADIISYDDLSDKWVNMEPTTHMLQDVQITAPQDGQLLVYSEEDETWQNRNLYSFETGVITPIKEDGTFQQLSCYKIGNVVNASARHYDISELASGAFFTLPVGFRPKYTTYTIAYVIIGGSPIPCLCDVNTNGTVNISYSGSQTLTQVAFAITFPIENVVVNTANTISKKKGGKK